MKTLEQLQASRKRWMTRLVRATNEVAKLDKKIHRLNGKLKATTVLPPEPKATADKLPVVEVSEKVLDIPAQFVRKDEPQLIDKLKAKRPPVDKTKMPLTGNAAKAYLKEQSEAVTARRAKKKLA